MNAVRATVALCVLVLGAAESSAREVRWQQNLNQAARESAKSRKPMLLRFTASWCGYCKKMLRTTFRDEAVVEQINGCFIPVVVDGDANAKLSESLGVTGFPTTLIVSSKMQVVKKIVGYQSAAAMKRHLRGMCPRRQALPSTAGQKTTHVAPRSSGPMFDGYCLVSMLDDQKLSKGDARFAARYRGRIIWFRSADHRSSFAADPSKYLPANDGLCPISMTDGRTLKPGSPKHAIIYKGRLWFLADRTYRKTFAAAPRKYARVRTASRK